MPHFFFHVALRDALFEDRDGWHFADLDRATDYGRRLALDLRTTGNFMTAVVLVVDELGRERARVPIDNVVAFPHDRRAADPGADTRQAEPDGRWADVPSRGK